MKAKQLLFKLFSKTAMGIFKIMFHLPLLAGLGKKLYAASLFGQTSGLYFGKNYQAAVSAYHKALEYTQDMEEDPEVSFWIRDAYEDLGQMYENGLGVEKDELKAEEYYLRAGSRGNVYYEHRVATKSRYAQHWK